MNPLDRLLGNGSEGFYIKISSLNTSNKRNKYHEVDWQHPSLFIKKEPHDNQDYDQDNI